MIPPPNDIAVLHADRDLLVIVKPAGMLSVPGKGPDKQDCAASRARAAAVLLGLNPTGPLVVHRLDMDTSGILVFGLTPDAQRNLSAQFEARAVDKHYAAILESVPAADHGEIASPMRLDPARRPYQIIDHLQGQPAVTQWRLLAVHAGQAHIRFEPLTGRTHQLRLHAAAPPPDGLGCPIVNDILYGAAGRAHYLALSAAHAQQAPAPPPPPTPPGRLMLHAEMLSLRHPTTGAALRFSSPPDFEHPTPPR